MRLMSMRDTFLIQNAELQESDPSTDWLIRHEDKLGQGGYAKVFKVKRKVDELECALKFCEPRTPSERNMIINEIGLMNRARADYETVLQILASYDYRDRIWIFLELMDGDLT